MGRSPLAEEGVEIARLLKVLVAVGLLASLSTCGGSDTDAGSSTTAAPTSVVEEPAVLTPDEDLLYAVWGEQPLTLDIHPPAAPGDAPIVIYLPGRGLTEAPSWFVEDLSEEGAMVVVVRYAGRRSPGGVLADGGAGARAMGESVACAIYFARQRASELGSADPKVVLTGFSIGGGVAAHGALSGASLESRWEEHEGDGGPSRQVDCEVTEGSTHVDVLVGLAGAYDVFVPAYDGKYGRAYQQEHDPALQEFLASSIGANPGLEVRLLHGESDLTIPYEESVGFAEVLSDAGYDVQLTAFEGGHTEPPSLTIATIFEALGR